VFLGQIAQKAGEAKWDIRFAEVYNLNFWRQVSKIRAFCSVQDEPKVCKTTLNKTLCQVNERPLSASTSKGRDV
jgi:hypothetical protein